MLRLRYLVLAVSSVLMAPLLVLAPAEATAYPSIIPLPVSWNPEGIATAGHRFYSGSLTDGDIYRGDLRTGEGAVFVDVSGRSAAGLKADRRHGLLFVAGAGTGRGFVYDLATGDDVADLALGFFVNDVVVTRTAAYFTESAVPLVYKVPIGAGGALGVPETIAVTGPAGVPVPPGGFGLNGIDATANGRTLIVCRSDLAGLYTINSRTGASSQIAMNGAISPSPDGILRVGHRIWVVENSSNQVSKVRVSPNWASGVLTQTVTNPAFHFPTTVARHGRRLVVVNAKFDLGFLPPPGTTFEAVQFKP
jgi:hypothetical protein